MMFTRRTTLSLLTCIMAASALTPFSVHAASDNGPDLSFYPAQKWSVDEVSDSRALKSCALSNNYNNGFVVQLAGSQDGFANLNIDFKQKSFTPGKRYEVQYSIPGGERKTLPTKAFKDSLLVTDLRKNAAFVEDMKTAGVVDVQIRENSFRLYLTGLQAAMKDFTECTTPDAPPAVSMQNVTPAPSTAQKVAASDIQEPRIEKRIEQENLAPPPPMVPHEAPVPPAVAAPQPEQAAFVPPKRTRYTEILAEQMKQQAKLFSASDTTATAQHARSVQANASSDPAPIVQEPQQNMASAQNVMADPPAPVRRADAIPPAPVQAPASVPATPQVSQVSAPPPARNVQASNVQTMSIPAAKVNKEVINGGETDFTKVGLNDDRSSAAPQAQQKDDGIYVSMADDNSAPDAKDLASIEPSAGPPVNDFADMRKRIMELEQQVASLKQENATLDNELKSNLKDSEQERLSVSSDNWNLERATMRYNEAERQVNRLGQQMQSYKAQCEQEKLDLKTMLFDPQITSKQQLAELASLKDELSKTKTDMAVQQRTYEERIRLLEAQLAQTPQ